MRVHVGEVGKLAHAHVVVHLHHVVNADGVPGWLPVKAPVQHARPRLLGAPGVHARGATVQREQREQQLEHRTAAQAIPQAGVQRCPGFSMIVHAVQVQQRVRRHVPLLGVARHGEGVRAVDQACRPPIDHCVRDLCARQMRGDGGCDAGLDVARRRLGLRAAPRDRV